jgi:hypothetical protein
MHDNGDEESEDREKYDYTYHQSPRVATEGQNVPIDAKVLEGYDYGRRKN